MSLQRLTTRAVVLARGLGKRMRETDPGTTLSREQLQAAEAGLKAMMPVNGRPFIDYVLGSLAEAGLSDVALVVAPDHEALRGHFAASPPARLRVAFVVQDAALGTANAMLAAESWTRGEPFVALNADNLYPVATLRDLAALDEPGFPAFEAGDLVRSSNIPSERIRAFAVATVDAGGYLTAIVEKPEAVDLPPDGRIDLTGSMVPHRAISMNCWRFDARIFDACRTVPRSARGEFELPEAVGVAIAAGMRFKAIAAGGPVLDLSRRADAADVARRLAGVIPCL